MAEFMLIFHQEAATYGTKPPEERQQILAEYAAWRIEIEEQGHYLNAHKLVANAGRCLLVENGEVRIVDGPYAEAKEVIGGYVLLRADNFDEALKIAHHCPHLKHGSRLELREIGVIEEPQL